MRMPTAHRRRRHPRRKHPHRVYIARGEHVTTFTLRPWMMAGLVMIGLGFSGCYFAATYYLVLRDDLVAADLIRQKEVTRLYEDRILNLRAEIDRLTNRHLVNQETVEAKLETLLGRQADLDERQEAIAALTRAAKAAGLLPGGPSSDVPSPPRRPTAASSVDRLTTGAIRPTARPPIGQAPLRLTAAAGLPPGPAEKIGVVEESLDTLARRQVGFVADMSTRVAGQSAKIAAVLKKVGVSAPKRKAAVSEDGVGGPLVEIDEATDPDAFRTQVGLITEDIEQLAGLRRKAGQLPLTRPIPSAAVTSKFGTRVDPFLRRPAMHTGIDFKSGYGFPVRSTAPGKVIAAEYAGGYGNMVEIDHGNGITTRYGHMSKIAVKIGQVLPKGSVVGRVGSTGRSTGPHLHYEVRVNGAAIDPMRYLRAGMELGSLL